MKLSRVKKILLLNISVIGAVSIGACTFQASKVKVRLRIDTSAMDLYYEMIDKASEEGVEIDGKFFRKNYIEKGNSGLQKYYAIVSNNKQTDEDAYEVVWERFKNANRYLIDNREAILESKNVFENVDLPHIAKKLSSFLDKDFDSTFYFLIGAGGMGGTAFSDGILVDASMIYSDKVDYADYPLPELVPYLLKKDVLISFFIHEMMHQLQETYQGDDFEGPSTIGDIALEEGGANFFASVLLDTEDVLGMREQGPYFKHNPQIMEEFIADRNINRDITLDDDTSVVNKWFFNYGMTAEGVPPDMGYYLGYVIANNYYQKAKNKKNAFLEIVKYWNNQDAIFDVYINQ